MQQLVIKDGKVMATHSVDQNLVGLYPDCEIILSEAQIIFDILKGIPDDPRTEEEKANTYKDRRRMLYPTVVDQLDMIYWDKINGTTNWVDTISEIKASIPKTI